MPSPFPGMDPFLETNPIFQELHTQMLAEMQAMLQPQLRPKYVGRLERHLSEEELNGEELELRKQRRIVIYVQGRPRLAVTGIELLSPGNKQPGAVVQERYLEKRASALHGGLHWVEIDLLRGGMRPWIPVPLPKSADYLSYVAQATPTGWNHLVYAWALRDPLPVLPIPLLGEDQAKLELGGCFAVAYDRIAADDEVDYGVEPPPPALTKRDAGWIGRLLRERGLRKKKPRRGPSRQAARSDTRELAVKRKYMSSLSAVQIAVFRFATEHNQWILPSGLYDLFPERPRAAGIQPPLQWPAKWPNGKHHGVYLFFADTPKDPEFLYVGKSSGKTSCLRKRLDGYVDIREFKATGQCKLLQEWDGYQRPWAIEPRYLLTVALETDPDTGTCPAAKKLEEYLFRECAPSQNVKWVKA
jgi:hypothetical protein